MTGDESGGYRIGFRELYEQITTLAARLDTLTNQHSQQIGALQAKDEVHAKALQVMWNRLEQQEKEHEDRGRFNLTTAITVLSSAAALIISVIEIVK